MTLIERIHNHDYDCRGANPGTLTLSCFRSKLFDRLNKSGGMSPYMRLALNAELRISVVGGSLR